MKSITSVSMLSLFLSFIASFQKKIIPQFSPQDLLLIKKIKDRGGDWDFQKTPDGFSGTVEMNNHLYTLEFQSEKIFIIRYLIAMDGKTEILCFHEGKKVDLLLSEWIQNGCAL